MSAAAVEAPKAESSKVIAPAGRLKGKVALITGGSRGIGLAVAKAYAREGASLAIAARTPSELKAASTELSELGAKVTAIKVDLNSPKAADNVISAAIRAFGRIDVLVNNASILGRRASLATYSPADWDAVMRTNIDAVFYLTRAVLGTMLPSNEGSIINVTSGVAKKGTKDWGAYSVSKAALENFTEVLADDLSRTGVRVNALGPGMVNTRMHGEAFPKKDLSTLPNPEDIVNAFIYLACDCSKGVTGQILHVDDFIGRSF